MKFESIRQQCCDANRALENSGLVDLTFGNVSVLNAEAEVFAIKPSGVEYRELSPESMVVVDLEGNVVDGSLRYSSDTPTHRRLYREFMPHGIHSIVHTHSRNAVAFAQAGAEIPCLGTTHADFFFGSVPVTRNMNADEIHGDYEWETGNVIVERFAGLDPTQFPGVLVNDHGPFVWGVNATKALECALALEAIADIAIRTLSLSVDEPPISRHLLEKHFLRKHGKSAYYGQDNQD